MLKIDLLTSYGFDIKPSASTSVKATQYEPTHLRSRMLRYSTHINGSLDSGYFYDEERTLGQSIHMDVQARRTTKTV